MEVVTISPTKFEAAAVQRAVHTIKDGGVVAYPTDTAYGLAVDALNEAAIGKLFIIKQRVQKPLPVVVDSLKMLERIAVVTPEERKLIKRYWPGALTIIFKRKSGVPPSLTLGLPTIGVRIPDSKIALAIIKAVGRPLTSTSANITGHSSCYTPECVVRMFQEAESQPDLVFDAGELAEIPVSTVVQIVDRKLKVIREGPVKISR